MDKSRYPNDNFDFEEEESSIDELGLDEEDF
jgi:hypothetical protein